MPRKKVDIVVLEETEEVAVQPRRSGRKRKSIPNYAESKAEDAEWKASPEKKTKIKKTTKVTAEATVAVPVNAPIVVDDESPSPPPAPRPRPKKRARNARDDELEYDHAGNEIRKREYVYMQCVDEQT
jgi:hypothetical protein